MLPTVGVQTLVNHFLEFFGLVRIKLLGILFEHDLSQDIVLHFLVLRTEYNKLLDYALDALLEHIQVLGFDKSLI
jgi:hypothetical protein